MRATSQHQKKKRTNMARRHFGVASGSPRPALRTSGAAFKTKTVQKYAVGPHHTKKEVPPLLHCLLYDHTTRTRTTHHSKINISFARQRDTEAKRHRNEQQTCAVSTTMPPTTHHPCSYPLARLPCRRSHNHYHRANFKGLPYSLSSGRPSLFSVRLP